MIFLKKTDHLIAKIEEAVVVFMVFSIILVNVLQIFLRAMEIKMPSYSTSINQVLVLWLAMVGGSLATREAEHIKVDFVSRYLKGKIRKIMMVFINMFAAIICAFLIKCSVDFIILEYRMNEMLTAIPVPLWILQVIMPISLSVILFRFFLLLLEEIRQIKS